MEIILLIMALLFMLSYMLISIIGDYYGIEEEKWLILPNIADSKCCMFGINVNIKYSIMVINNYIVRR